MAHLPEMGAAIALTREEEPQRAGVETITGAEPVRVGAGDAAARMAERTREGVPETLPTSDEVAERVGLKTRQSVHDWLKKGRIVGWRGAKRGYVFPAGQFDDRSRPVQCRWTAWSDGSTTVTPLGCG